jgi:hypothetical protein
MIGDQMRLWRSGAIDRELGAEIDRMQLGKAAVHPRNEALGRNEQRVAIDDEAAHR